jgi:hypothetical protein
MLKFSMCEYVQTVSDVQVKAKQESYRDTWIWPSYVKEPWWMLIEFKTSSKQPDYLTFEMLLVDQEASFGHQWQCAHGVMKRTISWDDINDIDSWKEILKFQSLVVSDTVFSMLRRLSENMPTIRKALAA